MKRFLVTLVAGLCLGLAGAGAPEAQTRVDAKQDWSVFVASENGDKICWIVSQPTDKRAIRDGRRVQVRRGDIFLMVAVRPADDVENEISFLSGYPFKKGSEVKVTVGDNNYTMFTDGEYAWTPTPADDKRLTDAFRRGLDARVEGLSSRGTTTIDEFSLKGFTAALEVATERCK